LKELGFRGWQRRTSFWILSQVKIPANNYFEAQGKSLLFLGIWFNLLTGLGSWEEFWGSSLELLGGLVEARIKWPIGGAYHSDLLFPEGLGFPTSKGWVKLFLLMGLKAPKMA